MKMVHVVFGTVENMNGSPIIILGIFLTIWTGNCLKVEKDVFETIPLILAHVPKFFSDCDAIGTIIWRCQWGGITANNEKEECNVNAHEYLKM